MTTPKDCNFCRANSILRGTVLAESAQAYLLRPEPYNESHLIVPAAHIEELADLPDTWWADFKQLLPQVPGLPKNYNLSLNYGKEAGQTLKHLHFWVIPRQPGTPSSGKGLAKLINEANEE